MMMGALALVTLLAVRDRQLNQRDAVLLIAAYPGFVAVVWFL